MLGGITNHFVIIASRLGPKDFKCKDNYGIDQNWPISYEDIKPYYDKLDRLIGVFGTKENLPNDPDGFFLPPPKPRPPQSISGPTRNQKFTNSPGLPRRSPRRNPLPLGCSPSHNFGKIISTFAPFLLTLLDAIT